MGIEIAEDFEGACSDLTLMKPNPNKMQARAFFLGGQTFPCFLAVVVTGSWGMTLWKLGRPVDVPLTRIVKDIEQG